jgi:hypothetical protein
MMTKAPPLKSQKGRAACPRLRRIRFSTARHEVALLYEHPRDSDRVIERDLNLADVYITVQRQQIVRAPASVQKQEGTDYRHRGDQSGDRKSAPFAHVYGHLKQTPILLIWTKGRHQITLALQPWRSKKRSRCDLLTRI